MLPGSVLGIDMGVKNDYVDVVVEAHATALN